MWPIVSIFVERQPQKRSPFIPNLNVFHIVILVKPPGQNRTYLNILAIKQPFKNLKTTYVPHPDL